MKILKKQKMFGALMLVMMTVLFVGMNGIRVQAETIREADAGTASSGCSMLGLKGSFLTDTEAALEYINEIRYEACENGYKDPRNSSRNLTLEDYKPIQWSQSLEMIARMRAAEASMTMAHERLNGKTIWGVTYGGISMKEECLAWHYGDDVLYGITQWYTEKKYWTTSESGVTGHYESLINPNNTYVGLGNFYSEAAHYSSTLAGAFSNTCGSLGSTPLEEERDIIQKVEVKDTYYSSIVECDDKIGEGTTQMVLPKAIVSYPGGYSTKVDLLYSSYQYASSNPSVATISSTGELTAKAKGTTTITISSGGKTIASKNVEIGCPHDYVYTRSGMTYSKKCSLCGDTGDYESFQYWVFGGTSTTGSFGIFSPKNWSVGDEYYVWPAYKNSAGDAQISKPVSVESSDSDVMTITKNGYDNIHQMKFLKPGIAELRITPKEDPKLASTYTIRVQGDSTLNIDTAEVRMPEETYSYDKKEKQPIPKLYYNEILLKSGTDYTISYENNIDPGIATVVITGNGVFSGTKTVDFVIEKQNLKDAKLTLNQTSYAYTGSAIEPAMKVALDSTTLEEGTDYTVSYAENVDVGTGKVTVQGMNSYVGEASQTFTISPAPAANSNLTVSCEETTYNGAEQTPNITVKEKLNTLKEGVDYTVEKTSKIHAGEYGVTVAFTRNYTGSVTTTWIIQKAKASISKAAAAKELVYTGAAQALVEAGSAIGGQVVYSLDGQNYTTQLPEAVNAGNYQVYYKVSGDSDHLDGEAETLNVTISKATPSYLLPEELTGYCKEHLSDVELPAGFVWETEDAVLSAIMDDSMTKVNACVTYTPDDIENYEKVFEIPVSISVKHNLEVQADGKGNHSEKCKDCSYHRESVPCYGGEASCCNKAVCEICNTEYGDYDKNHHVQTTMIHVKEATCKEEGYTGDQVCCDCGELLEEGQKVPKLTTHTYQNGICTICGKKEEIAEEPSQGNDSDGETNQNNGGANDETTKPGNQSQNASVEVGTKVENATAQYVVCDAKAKEVTFIAPVKKDAKTITVPETITIEGVKYKVTKVNANAFKGKQKVTKIVIGKNVKYIGKNAFKGCNKLKTILVKSKSLTSKSVAKQAFSGIKKTTKITVPKNKLSAYKKLFQKKGLLKKVKVKA